MPAGDLHEPVTQHDVRLQLGAAQVEIAMSKPQLLGGERLPLAERDGNRGGVRRPDHAHRDRLHLDVAGRELRVAAVLRARDDLALDEHHALAPHRSGELDRLGVRELRVEGHLDDTGAVAQVEEDDAAHRALALHPAAELHARADIGAAERAAELRPQRGGERVLAAHALTRR